MCLPVMKADQGNCKEGYLFCFSVYALCSYEYISEHLGDDLKQADTETQGQIVPSPFLYKVFFSVISDSCLEKVLEEAVQ